MRILLKGKQPHLTDFSPILRQLYVNQNPFTSTMLPQITISRWTGKKANAKGQLPVVFQTSVKGRKIIKSSGMLATADEWDGAGFKKSVSNAQLKNQSLHEKKVKYEREILLLSMNGHITYDSVKNIFFGKLETRDFFSFARARIDEKNYEPSTRKSYGIELDKIKEYASALSLTDITPQFLERYEQYLRGKGNKQNTVWKAMKFIKTMVLDALKAKHLADNPFDIYKGVKFRNPEKSYLNLKEIGDFMEVVTTAELHPAVRLAGLYFLRQCYSGLRISDNMKMDRKNIANGWIILQAKKTKKPVKVPIKNPLLQVLDLIGNERLIITDQVYNRHLKDLAGLAGIDKKVTSHTGRHTLGYLCAHYNVPPHITMRVMGHAKIETTMIYYHLEDETVSREMDKFNVA